MARRSMSAPVTAEMLIGTCCSGCSMRVAVTTTASSKAASRRVMTVDGIGGREPQGDVRQLDGIGRDRDAVHRCLPETAQEDG